MQSPSSYSILVCAKVSVFVENVVGINYHDAFHGFSLTIVEIVQAIK